MSQSKQALETPSRAKVPKRKPPTRARACSVLEPRKLKPKEQDKSQKSTHHLYKQCLSLQKEKEERRQSRLKLENRVKMLKKELQRQFRNKARNDRKKEALRMLHEEQAETKRAVEAIKQQREKKLEQRRIEFGRRRSREAARLNRRKQQSLEYKQTLAQNARYESQIRLNLADRERSKEKRRRVSHRNKVRNSLSSGSTGRNSYICSLMNGLAEEYEEKAKKEAESIRKEDKMKNKLEEEVATLSELIKEMQTKGRISGGFNVKELMSV